MNIISVVGARPNFMKIAPFIKAIEAYNQTAVEQIVHTLVHTGQHYDDRMSKAFFEALGIPDAHINLGIGSGSHAEQVGYTMIAFEKVLLDRKPDWVVVVGDVNATLACSVTAKKLQIKVCHIEAGLRSGDMSMPEEVNRLVTDRLSDLLLTPDVLSSANLKLEGTADNRVVFVGNIMIDTLEANRNKAQDISIESIVENNLQADVLPDLTQDLPLAVVTLHRPSNVDDPKILSALVEFFVNDVCPRMRLIWTVHPRTAKQLQTFGLWQQLMQTPNLVVLHPLGYHDMLKLNMSAKIMFTDSGGLQEECSVLGTPCLTLRWNTERPITLREHGGASVLVGNNVEKIRAAFYETIALPRTPDSPPLWDGHTAQRALAAILNYQI
jgi:UDP-N-acetylglucosamine 2-epimerase (non-hydrolysing)